MTPTQDEHDDSFTMPIEEVRGELTRAGLTGISFQRAGRLFKQIADLTAENARLRVVRQRLEDGLIAWSCPRTDCEDSTDCRDGFIAAALADCPCERAQ